jgi:glycosyltransferase involved in cell wall biosynthesis
VSDTENIIVESYASKPANLRIALVTETFPPEVNGVAMTLGRLVDGVLKLGHQVQVVRPRQGRGDSARRHEALDEVLARGVPLPNYGDLRFGMPSQNRLAKLWLERRPDVVHVATEGPLGWSAITAARKLKIPVTSSFHTNFHAYTGHYGMGLLKAPVAAYLRKLHNRTQATLVPTRSLANLLQDQGYRNVGLLARGVATELFTPRRRSQALRAAWGVKDHDLVVLHVGRLAKEKNLGVVLNAFAAIQSRQLGAKMVFVGDGPLHKALRQACPEAIFAGVQKGEALAEHYASADMFLFSSLTETYGNVVPEALASGLGVVSYATAAAAELINSEHNGMLVYPGDEVAFVNAAVALATDGERLHLVRDAAAPSVAHIGWDAVFDGFINTLYKVLEQHGRLFAPATLRPALAPVNPTNA